MRKMKDSGVEWIGEIPEEWELIPIGALTDKVQYAMVDGPFGSDLKNEEYVDEGIPIVQLTNIRPMHHNTSTLKFVTPEKADSLKRHNAKNGDLVIAKMMPAGRTCILSDISERYVVCADVIKASIADRYIKRFVAYAMNNYGVVAAETMSSGSTRVRISLSIAKKLKIAFPQRNELLKVVDYLDAKCSKIDSIIARQEEIIEKLKEYKLSVITEAVTKGLDPDVEMKDSGVEWIGKIPKHWNVSKLKQVALFFNGDRSSKYPSGEDIVKEGIPFITSNNLGQIYLDTNIDSNKFITREKYDDLGGAKLFINDIVFCLRGSVGKCGLNKTLTDGTIASSLVDIRPNGINAEFLNMVLHNPGVTAVASVNAIGIGSLNLSAKDISEVYVPIPPDSEANEIAIWLQQKTLKIERMITKYEAFIEKLNSYKKSLIYEVVTGKKEV